MEVIKKFHSEKASRSSEMERMGLQGFRLVAVHKGTNDENPIHAIAFTGSRYELGNGFELPYFYDWVSNNLGIDPSNRKVSNPEPTSFPSPIVNEGLSS